MFRNILNISRKYTFNQLLVRFAEEYIWWIIKSWPGVEGVTFRYIFLKCTTRKIDGFCWISKGCTIVNSFGLSIGKNFAVNTNVLIDGIGGIFIGDNSGIGPNSVLISQEHKMLSKYGFVGGESYRNSRTKPIQLGSDVWIGANCFIKAGVEIGNNSVVGACSNVLTDLPEDSKVIGSPARPYFQVMREFFKPQ